MPKENLHLKLSDWPSLAGPTVALCPHEMYPAANIPLGEIGRDKLREGRQSQGWIASETGERAQPEAPTTARYLRLQAETRWPAL